MTEVRLWGPNGGEAFRFGLDTGATETVVSIARLVLLGYGFSSSECATLVTASATESAPRILAQRIRALGQERSDFPVLAYTLPAEIGVDGMLGLDFFRGLRLTVDFRVGQISLE
jgi:predicted aspartyl protease